MQRYDSYKDSGVQWLGEIPSHWEVKRLDKECQFKKGLQFTKADLVDEGMPVVSYGQVHSKGNSRTHLSEDLIRFVPESFINNISRVEVGDFIVADTSEDIEGSGNMAYNDCKDLLYAGYHTIIIKINDFDNKKYLAYLFNSSNWRCQIRSKVNGVKVYTINREILKKSYILIPSSEEQNAIVDFLDKATAEIDEAISQQQKMIDLLNERKQIIINNAVTKGLNPNAKMKDSGVEWIGEIPEGWEVSRIKALGTTVNGVSNDSSYFGEGFPFVSYSDVYKNMALPKQVVGLAKSTPKEQIAYSVEEGDVFFTRTSETAEEIGFSSTCMETIPNAVFAGFLIRFRPKRNVLNKTFSKYYFRAHIHRSYFVKEMNLVIRASLSQNLLKGLPVLLPPLNEQIAIGNYLDEQTAIIDDAILSYKKQIELLQERKQILINEVVTGKVKVG